ncbi:HTH_48 domain-containing protein [Trichonephila clavipes]|nr:HTH_48 domain-containing protein [Trichonephila clavipes]
MVANDAKPKTPNWPPKMMPTWLYRQDFAKFSFNRHYNSIAAEDPMYRGDHYTLKIVPRFKRPPAGMEVRRREGRQSVNSDPRSGRQSTSRNEDKIAQIKAVVRSYRCLTVQEIAQECQISVGSCDEILRVDLNMRGVSAKFVPRLLTEDQQFQRLATSSDLFQSESDDQEFMKLIITGDESWVYEYDPETKQ